jgi:protein-S-isoprenylcysteine O-methyltransferase Ste14
MPTPERVPKNHVYNEIRDTTLKIIDIETQRLQSRVTEGTRNAGRKLVAGIIGTALVLLGIQSAVLALLFVLHERATQFIVRPGVAWPMAGLATALLLMGFVALIWAIGNRRGARKSSQ